MIDDVRLISMAERDYWIAANCDGGLPSQSWSYACALSASGVTPQLAVIHSRGAKMVLPFFERPWLTDIDIATIFRASGASISSNSTAPLSLWREFAKAQGWVAGYIQLSPLTDLPECVAVDGDAIVDRPVFLLDLNKEDLFRSFSVSIRQKIRKTASSNPVLIEDRTTLSHAVQELYPPMMQRLRARESFNFSVETLRGWSVEPTSVVLGCAIDGAVEAVSIFLVAGQHAEYHLNACTEGGREMTAWLLWKAITRLRDSGVRLLNLGAGLRAGDGVDQFKRRFHGRPVLRRSVGQIYDRDRYEALCAGDRARPGWFPAYRAIEAGS
jgi:hypothetical protein